MCISNNASARPFMTEILLICCICIKAPAAVESRRCVSSHSQVARTHRERERESQPHNYIIFFLSSCLLARLFVAAAGAASVVVAAILFSCFVYSFLFRFVSFYLFIYLCWACVYLFGCCVSVFVVHGTQQSMTTTTIAIATTTTTTSNNDCCSAFAYKHMFVADATISYSGLTLTHSHKHASQPASKHICALVLSFTFSRSFFVGAAAFSSLEIQFDVYA